MTTPRALIPSRKTRLTTVKQLRERLDGELSRMEVYQLLNLLRRANIAVKVGYDITQRRGQPAHIWRIPTWVKLDLSPVESNPKPRRKPRKKTAIAVPPLLP